MCEPRSNVESKCLPLDFKLLKYQISNHGTGNKFINHNIPPSYVGKLLTESSINYLVEDFPEN